MARTNDGPLDFEGAFLVDNVVTRNDDLHPAFAFRKFSSDKSSRFNFCRAIAEAVTAYP